MKVFRKPSQSLQLDVLVKQNEKIIEELEHICDRLLVLSSQEIVQQPTEQGD